MRGWTTSDLKKKKKFNKNVSVKDLLQLFAVYACLYIYVYVYVKRHTTLVLFLTAYLMTILNVLLDFEDVYHEKVEIWPPAIALSYRALLSANEHSIDWET